MTITKPRLVVTAVLGGVATGVIGDAIWDGIKYTVSRIGVHVCISLNRRLHPSKAASECVLPDSCKDATPALIPVPTPR